MQIPAELYLATPHKRDFCVCVCVCVSRDKQHARMPQNPVHALLLDTESLNMQRDVKKKLSWADHREECVCEPAEINQHKIRHQPTPATVNYIFYCLHIQFFFFLPNNNPCVGGWLG